MSRLSEDVLAWHFVTLLLHVSQTECVHSTLYTLHSTLHTPHFTLYTPHSTLHTLNTTLHTLHPTLHTLHVTLHTLHTSLHTLHTSLHTLHSPLYTPHFTLSTLHSTLYTPHSTLYTLHSHFSLYSPHSTLYTPHFTFAFDSGSPYLRFLHMICIRVRWFLLFFPLFRLASDLGYVWIPFADSVHLWPLPRYLAGPMDPHCQVRRSDPAPLCKNGSINFECVRMCQRNIFVFIYTLPLMESHWIFLSLHVSI